jgi:hypothetical protein
LGWLRSELIGFLRDEGYSDCPSKFSSLAIQAFSDITFSKPEALAKESGNFPLLALQAWIGVQSKPEAPAKESLQSISPSLVSG